MLDGQGRCLTVNKQGLEMMEAPASDVTGRYFKELWPSEVRPVIEENIAKAAEGQMTSFDAKRTIAGQSQWWNITLCAVRGGARHEGRLIAISNDITRRKKAEFAVKESEENLRTTMNSIGEAVITARFDGRITSMNVVAEELLGWRSEEVEDKDLQEVLDIRDPVTEEKVENLIREVPLDRDAANRERDRVLVTRDGSEKRILERGAPLRDRNGRAVGLVLVLKDMTDWYLMEQQIHHSQKMDALGQLAGGIAHDFNNMMSGAMGYAELIVRDCPEGSSSRGYAENIIRTVTRTADLTGKLLSFSRRGESKAMPFDLHQALDETLGILKRSIDRRIQVETSFLAEASVVVGDYSQVQNSLLNICINARDAMPQGGRLTVSTENYFMSESCPVSAFPSKPGMHILISIRDTGTGMSRQVQEKIFEPFFTTKEPGKGTGLGLATAYGTVVNHDGSITVHSHSGKGTVFNVVLPVDQQATADEKGLFVGALHSKGGHILIIDDEEAVRTPLALLLEKGGCEVTVAGDGSDGVRIYSEKKDTISAVILDMVMPNMNGLECLRGIRQVNADAVVFIYSGMLEQSMMREINELGCQGFLSKPFRADDVVKLLSKVITLDSALV